MSFLFVQFWTFVSPVAYPIWPVPVKWRPLYGLNPMAGVIEGFRWSLVGTGDAPSRMLLVAGMVYFQKMEPTSPTWCDTHQFAKTSRFCNAPELSNPFCSTSSMSSFCNFGFYGKLLKFSFG
jgi:hypothetical protein